MSIELLKSLRKFSSSFISPILFRTFPNFIWIFYNNYKFHISLKPNENGLKDPLEEFKIPQRNFPEISSCDFWFLSYLWILSEWYLHIIILKFLPLCPCYMGVWPFGIPISLQYRMNSCIQRNWNSWNPNSLSSQLLIYISNYSFCTYQERP